MGDASDPYLKIVELSGENASLRREITEAAECGLAVVEEKQQLQQQYSELVDLYESTKNELNCAIEALNQMQKSHRIVNKIGVAQEESILKESATREAELLKDATDLRLELKNARNTIELLESEAGRFRTMAGELQSNIDILENQNKKLKRDKKELKARERKNMTEYAELEDENVALHKQLLHLRQLLVEYESLKQEISHLKSNVLDLRMEKEELSRLKKVVETQVEDLLEQLHIEREQKCALKLELEQHLSKLSMYSLQAGFGLDSLDGSHVTDFGDSGLENDDGDNPSLRHIEANLVLSSENSSALNNSSLGGDLFSEIHVSQVRSLEGQLEEANADKEELEKSLNECQKQLESAMSALQTHLNHSDDEKLKTMSSSDSSEEEISLLKEQILNYESMIGKLKHNFGSLSPEAVRDQLLHISKNLAQVLYLAGSLSRDGSTDSPKSANTSASDEGDILIDNRIDEPLNAPPRNSLDAVVNLKSCGSCEDLLDKIKGQVTEFEAAVKVLLKSQLGDHSSVSSSEDTIELYEEIAKLKSMIVTKNEKIMTLRCIIKENKATATSALMALKERYQEERTVVTETLKILREELRTLKDDATEFVALRAALTQRCDEYLAQVLEKTNQLSAVEEEKKILNSLLKSAIQQKIALTQRLEDVEFDVERRNIEQQRLAARKKVLSK